MSSPPAMAVPSAAEIAQLDYWIGFTLQVYSCFITLMIWDWLIQLSQEVQTIWKAKNSAIKFLYLFNRYFSILSNIAICCAYNIHVSTETCNKYVKLEPALPVFIVLAYQSILIMRMYALHNKNLILLISFVVLLLGEAAYLLYVVASTSALPYPAATGPCLVNGSHKLITGYFYLPMAVDIIITAVTFYRAFVLKARSPNSTVLQVFIKEGLIFFTVVCACNLVNGILYAQPNADISTIFAGASFILSSLMSSRLVLSLRAGSFGQDSSHTMQSSLNHGSNHASALRSLPSVGLEKSSTINLNEKMTRSKSDDEEISLSDLEGGNLADGIKVSKDTVIHYGNA